MDHIYFVEISWDKEAGVWYVADTDFPGLVAEAPSERDLLMRDPSTRARVVRAQPASLR